MMTVLEINSQQISGAWNATTSTALTLMLWSKITEPKSETEKILQSKTNDSNCVVVAMMLRFSVGRQYQQQDDEDDD